MSVRDGMRLGTDFVNAIYWCLKLKGCSGDTIDEYFNMVASGKYNPVTQAVAETLHRNRMELKRIDRHLVLRPRSEIRLTDALDWLSKTPYHPVHVKEAISSIAREYSTVCLSPIGLTGSYFRYHQENRKGPDSLWGESKLSFRDLIPVQLKPYKPGLLKVLGVESRDHPQRNTFLVQFKRRVSLEELNDLLHDWNLMVASDGDARFFFSALEGNISQELIQMCFGQRSVLIGAPGNFSAFRISSRSTFGIFRQGPIEKGKMILLRDNIDKT